MGSGDRDAGEGQIAKDTAWSRGASSAWLATEVERL
jgi:hypothetical protein